MIDKNEVNDMKKYIAILLALALTGCGAAGSGTEIAPNADQNSTPMQEEETTAVVSEEATEAENGAAAEDNDPKAATIVDMAFRRASAYERTLVVNGESRTIKGSYHDDGYRGLHDSRSYYDKPMRLVLTEGQIMTDSNKNEFYEYTAYAIDGLDPIDLMSSKDFTGLNGAGNVITGYTDAFGENIECTMTIENGILMELSADGISLTTDLDSFPSEWLSDRDLFHISEGNEYLLDKSGEAAFDFEAAGTEQIIKWAAEDTTLKDEGNGVTFRLTYDHPTRTEGPTTWELKLDETELTLDDIYIDPVFNYGEMKDHTLGEVGDIMKNLREYQLKMNDSTQNKKQASDKWFVIGNDTNGLPRWYYELRYGTYEERQEESQDFAEMLKEANELAKERESEESSD